MHVDSGRCRARTMYTVHVHSGRCRARTMYRVHAYVHVHGPCTRACNSGRYRARTMGPMAANLSSILMADLDLVQGRQLNYPSIGERSPACAQATLPACGASTGTGAARGLPCAHAVVMVVMVEAMADEHMCPLPCTCKSLEIVLSNQGPRLPWCYSWCTCVYLGSRAQAGLTVQAPGRAVHM